MRTEAATSELRELLGLSPREAEITQALIDDSKEIAIAHDLGISHHTVHAHVRRIYRKLGVSSRTQLLVRVFETLGRSTMD
jgi:DNA-binding NarL/FixJ family response regulator